VGGERRTSDSGHGVCGAAKSPPADLQNRPTHLSSASKVNHFRPAADPLFESMAQVFGRRSISVVLSGLLTDGWRGTAAVHKCGGLTMTQNKRTCEFFDMPSAAIDYGKAEVVLAPRRLALALDAVMDQASQREARLRRRRQGDDARSSTPARIQRPRSNVALPSQPEASIVVRTVMEPSF